MQSINTTNGMSKRSMTQLSLFTALLAASCAFFGYITLPFAAGMYATLLLAEQGNRRIVSYVLPVTTYIVNFLLNGLFSLEGVAYVAVGIIIYLCYKNSKTKSETAFYLSLAIFIMMIISLAFMAFENVGVVRFSSIKDFYYNLYVRFKDEFLSYVTSIVTKDSEGIYFFVYTLSEAENLFFDLITLTVPMFMIFSFLLCGVSLKTFDKSREKRLIGFERSASWRFTASKTVAVFYIIISLLNSFSTANDVMGMSILSLNSLFMFVFAYIGFSSVFRVIRRKTSGLTSLLILCFVITFMYAFIIQLLSYIGAYIVLFAAKQENKSSDV